MSEPTELRLRRWENSLLRVLRKQPDFKDSWKQARQAVKGKSVALSDYGLFVKGRLKSYLTELPHGVNRHYVTELLKLLERPDDHDYKTTAFLYRYNFVRVT